MAYYYFIVYQKNYLNTSKVTSVRTLQKCTLLFPGSPLDIRYLSQNIHKTPNLRANKTILAYIVKFPGAN